MEPLKRYLSPNDVQRWHALIGHARSIVVVGHASPDGDAMGAALALYHYLHNLRRYTTVIMPNRWPDFLRWLPGAKDVVNADYQPERAATLFARADLIFCVDFNSFDRTEKIAPLLQAATAHKIMIDHHVDPDVAPFTLAISDPSAVATCQIIFTLLRQLNYYKRMPIETAQCLYCGIMTDTGAFAYNSNSPSLFQDVAWLLGKGIDKDQIYRNVYYSYSLDRLRLQGYLLNQKLTYLPELHTAVFALTRQEMRDYNFKKGDAEGFVNLPLQIKGTVLSISLREDTEDNLVRVSLRSVGSFSCEPMAKRFFNGGGHANAAGGKLPDVSIDQALNITHRAIQAYADTLRNATP